MADRSPGAEPLDIVVPFDRPLIGVILEQNGQEVVRYFSDELAADAMVADEDTAGALALAGAWSDLDWQEMADALDRIRHERRPPAT